jgi:hypothetical protein
MMCVFLFLSLREYESVTKQRRLTHVLCTPQKKNERLVQDNYGFKLAGTQRNLLPEMHFTC